MRPFPADSEGLLKLLKEFDFEEFCTQSCTQSRERVLATKFLKNGAGTDPRRPAWEVRRYFDINKWDIYFTQARLRHPYRLWFPFLTESAGAEHRIRDL